MNTQIDPTLFNLINDTSSLIGSLNLKIAQLETDKAKLKAEKEELQLQLQKLKKGEDKYELTGKSSSPNK